MNYLIDSTFSKANRLFVLPFEKDDEDINDRFSFSEYFMPNVEIKDFNVLIDGRSFFDVSVKKKEETYKKIIKKSENDNYTTVNLLDYDYFSKHYQLIPIDLSK